MIDLFIYSFNFLGLENQDELEEYLEEQREEAAKARKNEENLAREAVEQKLKDEQEEIDRKERIIRDKRLAAGIIRRNKLRQYLLGIKEQRIDNEDYLDISVSPFLLLNLLFFSSGNICLLYNNKIRILSEVILDK